MESLDKCVLDEINMFKRHRQLKLLSNKCKLRKQKLNEVDLETVIAEMEKLIQRLESLLFLHHRDDEGGRMLRIFIDFLKNKNE